MMRANSYREGVNAALEKFAGQRLDHRIRGALSRMGVPDAHLEGTPYWLEDQDRVRQAGSSGLWDRLANSMGSSQERLDPFRLKLRQVAGVNGELRAADPTMRTLRERFETFKSNKALAAAVAAGASDEAHLRLRGRQARTGNAITADYPGKHRQLAQELTERNMGLRQFGGNDYATYLAGNTRKKPNDTPDTLRGRFLSAHPEKSYTRRALEDERVVYNVPKGRSYLLSRASGLTPADIPKQPGFGAGRIFYKGGPITGASDDPAWVSSSPGVSAGYARPSGNTPGLLQWFNGRDLGNPSTHGHNGLDTRGMTRDQVGYGPNAGRSSAGESPWYESVVNTDDLGTPGPLSPRNNRPAQGPSSRAIGHAAVGPYGVHVLGGVDPFKPDGSVARSIRAQGTPAHLVTGGWVPSTDAVKPSGADRYLMPENVSRGPLPWPKSPAPAVSGPSVWQRLGGWLRRGLRRGR